MFELIALSPVFSFDHSPQLPASPNSWDTCTNMAPNSLSSMMHTISRSNTSCCGIGSNGSGEVTVRSSAGVVSGGGRAWRHDPRCQETFDLPDPTWLQFRRRFDKLQPFCRIASHTRRAKSVPSWRPWSRCTSPSFHSSTCANGRAASMAGSPIRSSTRPVQAVSLWTIS